TRFTAAYLVGMIGVLVLANLFYYRRAFSVRLFARSAVLPVVIFTVVMGVTWAALYPGMWAAPGEVWAETVHGLENATSAHEEGNYYMGAPVDAPGADFYLWALLIRLTPVTIIGAGLAVVAAFTGAMRQQWRLWLAVLVYIIVYSVVMTTGAKKFDRYILPVFPALHLVAAFGWVWLAGLIGNRVQVPVKAAWAVAIAGIVGYGLWFYPADYAYTNPMVGSDRAQHILLIAAGGEGMNHVAAELERVSGSPKAAAQYVYTRYGDNLVYNTPQANIVRLDRMQVDVLGNAYYIVRTISYRQRDPWTEPVYASAEPLATVDIHGITYAEIYDAEEIRAFIRANAEDGEEWPDPDREDED
ncbi:MAG: hypothetical protein AAF653_09720, partial [Chloroflexota bacterium]